ncbi:MAG: hypothetical protein ACI8YQ_000804 [Polaribacter sp.]|jgi:hypothetical protein
MVVDPGPVFTSDCPDTVMVVTGVNLVVNKTANNMCSGTTANITYTVDLNNDNSIDNNGSTGSINEVTEGAAL